MAFVGRLRASLMSCSLCITAPVLLLQKKTALKAKKKRISSLETAIYTKRCGKRFEMPWPLYAYLITDIANHILGTYCCSGYFVHLHYRPFGDSPISKIFCETSSSAFGGYSIGYSANCSLCFTTARFASASRISSASANNI